MRDPKIRKFKNAMRHTQGMRRQVLLGNGFSIEYDERFSYGALADRAEARPGGPITPELRAALPGVFDFETMARHLMQAARLVEIYDPTARPLVGELNNGAEQIRLSLVETIMDILPSSGLDLDDGQVRSARAFLHNFTSVYSLNYDLLLYWVTTRPAPYGPCPQRDGFWKGGADALQWHPEHSTQIHHLHGALHLFERDNGVFKVKHEPGRRIAQQIAEGIQEGSYPLVVTEGTSLEKQARIQASPYLTAMLKRLTKSSGALFVHGASMDENDAHLFDWITCEKSRLQALHVGLYGGIEFGNNRDIIKRVRNLAKRRNEVGGALEVGFYDTASAKVWRGETPRG